MMTREEINEKKALEIEEEERREKNKKILKVLAYIFIPLFIIFVSGYVAVRYIGNYGLIVREYPVYDNSLPNSFNGVKIVQFSDLHYGNFSEKSKIDLLVSQINRTNPDIVVFTGDLIDSSYNITMDEKEYLISKLSEIKSSIGKYSIYGEEDNEITNDIFSNSDFEILSNEIIPIYKDDAFINIIAVDDNYSMYPGIKDSIEESAFTLVLTHMPDNSEYIVNSFNPNIILAGHSHNGQVRIPFIGPMMKKIGAKKYTDSYYEINNTKLYISGGIGNTKYNMRLFNHPSINFIRLKTNS